MLSYFTCYSCSSYSRFPYLYCFSVFWKNTKSIKCDLITFFVVWHSIYTDSVSFCYYVLVSLNLYDCVHYSLLIMGVKFCAWMCVEIDLHNLSKLRKSLILLSIAPVCLWYHSSYSLISSSSREIIVYKLSEPLSTVVSLFFGSIKYLRCPEFFFEEWCHSFISSKVTCSPYCKSHE